MSIGFDVISDLFLTIDESFNWEGKATSLYCVIAGNISNDVKVITQTLRHLSRFYQGIFYIDGYHEHEGHEKISLRHREIERICKNMPNVVFLRTQVVVLNGVALIGGNGWYGTPDTENYMYEVKKEIQRFEDIAYLAKTIEQLQLHVDVKTVVLVTSSAPCPEMFFGEEPDNILEQVALTEILNKDTEKKVKHWIYGSYNKTVDTNYKGINYINNSYYKRRPYWAKRLDTV